MIKRLIELHAEPPVKSGGGLDLRRILLNHDTLRASEGGDDACR